MAGVPKCGGAWGFTPSVRPRMFSTRLRSSGKGGRDVFSVLRGEAAKDTIPRTKGEAPVSAQHFQKLVVRALWEKDFRDLLFRNPDEAMKGFDLTRDERAELQRLEGERFEDLVAEVRMGLTTSLLKGGSDVAFNPQPEPPARIDLESLFGLRAS